MNDAPSSLIRHYRNKDDDVTIHTDYVVGKDDITLTLSPEEQRILLHAIRNGFTFNRDTYGKIVDENRHASYLKMLWKFETEVHKVGLDDHPLPGRAYYGHGDERNE